MSTIQIPNPAKPPEGARCQEASMLSHATYIPCGKPAVSVIANSDPNAYAMCATCADHNVRNRSARYVVEGEVYTLWTPSDARSDLAEVEFEEETAPAAPSNAALKSIGAMAARRIALAAEIAEAEAILKAKAESLRVLEEVELPKAMLDVGLTSFALVGGGSVALRTDYYASIKGANQDAAFSVLERRNAGSIIKRDISAQFPRGSKELADALIVYVRETYGKTAKVADKSHVAPNTLAAYVREQIAQGTLAEGDADFSILGGHVRRWAKVEMPEKPS